MESYLNFYKRKSLFHHCKIEEERMGSIVYGSLFTFVTPSSGVVIITVTITIEITSAMIFVTLEIALDDVTV